MTTYHNLDSFLSVYKTLKEEGGPLPRWGSLSFFDINAGKQIMSLSQKDFDRIISAINKEKR